MIKTRVIIVDDDPVVVNLTKEFLEFEDQSIEIFQTSEREEFLKRAGQKKFDVALIDISIGGREGGFELLRDLKTRGIDLPSIMLSAHDEMDYALKCLRAGARGYVNKAAISSDLLIGLREILAGNLFVSGDKGECILKRYCSSLS